MATYSPAVVRQRPRMWTPSTGNAPTSSKRARSAHDYDSDDEDDDSSDDEDAIFSRGPPPKKAGRRDHYRFSPRRGARPRWIPRKGALVRFSRPLVTAVRTRPRTSPQEKSRLFYCAADQAKFREEYRREKRMRLEGEWESSDDDESDEDVVPKPETAATTTSDDDAALEAKDVPHEVTESSSSNEDSDGDEEEGRAIEEDGSREEC